VAGGQTAPKAKKPPVAFNEEDLAASEFHLDDDWMKKIEAEWQLNELNRLSNFRSEKGLMGAEALVKEGRFAITGKVSVAQTNNLGVAPKLKTQDVGEFIRKAKQEFINRETGADPYEEECVVVETDPDEMDYPKHEPAQLSSIGKNKTNNLSQHTSSTVQQLS